MLNLGNNQIGDEGAGHLANGLKTNTVGAILHSSFSLEPAAFIEQVLTTLKLYGNEIGPIGAQHLAVALKYNTVNIVMCLTLFISTILRTDTNCTQP